MEGAMWIQTDGREFETILSAGQVGTRMEGCGHKMTEAK